MNELQIRLTADIRDLQSALAKAKQTLKSFETETATDISKSNQQREKTLGLIEEQIAKAKQLKISLAQATNEKDVAFYNAELEKTNAELARLNALGKSFANTSVQSFNKFRVSAGAAGGSAIAFNRIIQDAPFGIIGVGNNIQQFAEQLAALKVETGSTAGALSKFSKSLFTGTNLVILGVSAVTAAFTAYQLGVFDSAEETRDLNKELEDFVKTLDDVKKAQLQGAQSAQDEIQSFKLLKLQAENANLPLDKRILAVKELKRQYPDYLKSLTDEQILTGKVGVAYNELTKSIYAKAKAAAFSEQITENEKKILALTLQEEERSLQINELKIKKAKVLADSEKQQSIDKLDFLTNAEAIQGNINKLEDQNKISEEDRKKISAQVLSIQSKLPAEIEKAGGLIDSNTESIKDNLRELNYWELIQDRVNEKTDVQKKILTDLGKEQKTLFEQITRLRQEPINFINAASLIIAEQRLAEIDKIIGSIASKRTETEINIDENKLTGLELPTKTDPGIIEGLEKQIATFEKLKQVTSDPAMLALYTLKIDLLKNKLAEFNGEEVKSNLQLIADAFGSMGNQIANALGISNRSLRGFVTTLVSATPKIVAAILAKSEATRIAADQENIANAKLAAGNSVVVATEGAKALGPVGLALLPVFIAGALALVSSAFSKARGGGGSVSAGTGSTFTNREFGGPVSKGRAYIVGERRPELFVPNTNGIIVPQLPSMDYSGASMAAGAMAVDVNIRGVSYGDDILFTVQQAQIRQGIR